MMLAIDCQKRHQPTKRRVQNSTVQFQWNANCPFLQSESDTSRVSVSEGERLSASKVDWCHYYDKYPSDSRAHTHSQTRTILRVTAAERRVLPCYLALAKEEEAWERVTKNIEMPSTYPH